MNPGSTAAGQIGASLHTLSGARHGELSRWNLTARASAARSAGIQAIGACPEDLGYADPSWLADTVRQQHVDVDELEWVSLEDPPDADTHRLIFKLADVFQARRLNVGVCSADPEYGNIPPLARRLKRLARHAADHGVTVAVEPVVFGSLGTIEQVQHLVEATGEDNVGTVLDAYHWARADWTTSVRHVDTAMVVAIQVCGVDQVAPLPAYPHGLFAEAQCSRRLPDEGDFPVARWLHNLRAAGCTAPVEAEVISDQLRGMTPYKAAAAVASSMSRLMQQVEAIAA